MATGGYGTGGYGDGGYGEGITVTYAVTVGESTVSETFTFPQEVPGPAPTNSKSFTVSVQDNLKLRRKRNG